MTNILLLHGATGSRDELLPLAETLGDGFQWLAPNLIGHGGRPIPDRFEIEDLLADLLGALDAAGMERAFVFGYSFGGFLAMILAHRHPERVIGCCTLGAKYRWDEGELGQLLALIDQVQAGNRKLGDESDVFHLQNRFRDLLERRHQGEQWLPEERLSEITLPMLAMNGDADFAVSEAETKALMDVLENVRVVIFGGAAHPVAKLPAAMIAGHVRAFVRDVEALPAGGP